jgi:polysaccharide export outer membrane protein
MRIATNSTIGIVVLLASMLALGASAGQKHGAASTPATDPPAKAIVPPKPSRPSYVIGEQDVLSIDVWREKELSGTVVVRPDGMITVPLLNDIYVLGMPPEHLAEIISRKLKPFVAVPKVTVTVRAINSRKVYVIGEVSHAGVFPINSTTTVLQLLAEAGGVGDFANRKNIYILRTTMGKQVRLPFNYDAVIKGKDSKENVVLHPGDTVVVP